MSANESTNLYLLKHCQIISRTELQFEHKLNSYTIAFRSTFKLIKDRHLLILVYKRRRDINREIKMFLSVFFLIFTFKYHQQHYTAAIKRINNLIKCKRRLKLNVLVSYCLKQLTPVFNCPTTP